MLRFLVPYLNSYCDQEVLKVSRGVEATVLIINTEAFAAFVVFVLCCVFVRAPRGRNYSRRLTGRQKIQGNQYQKERLIRHSSQSGHGSGDSGPKWLAHPRSENHAEEKSFHPQKRNFWFYIALVVLFLSRVRPNSLLV